jgi:hypothetical protein
MSEAVARLRPECGGAGPPASSVGNKAETLDLKVPVQVRKGARWERRTTHVRVQQ